MTWNEFNFESLIPLADPTSLVYRGKGFSWSHLRLNVASGNVYYYSFVTSSAKHTVIYNRSFEAGVGPVSLDIVVGATFTAGTEPIPASNLFLGRSAPDIVIVGNVTNVVGGTVSPVAYAFGAGNNAPVAATAGLPTIFPPGATLLVRVTNSSTNPNPGIRFALAFAEIKIPPYIYES